MGVCACACRVHVMCACSSCMGTCVPLLVCGCVPCAQSALRRRLTLVSCQHKSGISRTRQTLVCRTREERESTNRRGATYHLRGGVRLCLTRFARGRGAAATLGGPAPAGRGAPREASSVLPDLGGGEVVHLGRRRAREHWQ